MTSSLVDAADFRVTIEPSEENGLRRVSQVMADKPTTVRRERIGSRIGCLPTARRATPQPGNGVQPRLGRLMDPRAEGKIFADAALESAPDRSLSRRATGTRRRYRAAGRSDSAWSLRLGRGLRARILYRPPQVGGSAPAQAGLAVRLALASGVVLAPKCSISTPSPQWSLRYSATRRRWHWWG